MTRTLNQIPDINTYSSDGIKNDPIPLFIESFSRILAQDNPNDMLIVYLILLLVSRLRGNPTIDDEMRYTDMGRDRIKKAKKRLMEHGLIEQYRVLENGKFHSYFYYCLTRPIQNPIKPNDSDLDIVSDILESAEDWKPVRGEIKLQSRGLKSSPWMDVPEKESLMLLKDSILKQNNNSRGLKSSPRQNTDFIGDSDSSLHNTFLDKKKKEKKESSFSPPITPSLFQRNKKKKEERGCVPAHDTSVVLEESPKSTEGDNELGDLSFENMNLPNQKEYPFSDGVYLQSKNKLPLKLTSNKEFMNTWAMYFLYRKEIKKQITKFALPGMFTVLSSMTPQEAIDTINRAMMNQWTGLFPEKKSFTQKTPVQIHEQHMLQRHYDHWRQCDKEGNMRCYTIDNTTNQVYSKPWPEDVLEPPWLDELPEDSVPDLHPDYESYPELFQK